MWMNIHFAKCAEKFVESANLDGLSSSRSSHRSGLISSDGSSIWEVSSLLFQKYLGTKEALSKLLGNFLTKISGVI